MPANKKALLLVDIQYDFLPPQGSLAVSDGEMILPHIYELLDHASEQYDVIVASMHRIVSASNLLWIPLHVVLGHPMGHISFASTHSRTPFTEISVPKLNSQGKTIPQMLWPDHCIQETHGSKIEDGVQTRLDALNPEKVVYIRKGTHTDVDAYSAFSDNEYTVFTPLARVLYERGITEVEVVGLALDYCVKSTAIDARKFGFTTRLLRKCTKAVDPACVSDLLDSLKGSWDIEVID